MDTIPESIKKLAERRNQLRGQKRYAQSDAVRKKIEKMGYALVDEGEQTRILKKEAEQLPPEHSFLVLFGSGEISPTGARIHNYVFEKLGKKEISIALITTPAGFQPNVKTVYEEIAEFFVKHLINYHPRVSIVYANTREQADNPDIIRAVDYADYIFTGPGSPTYAVHHLKNSLLLKKIEERVQAGVSLSLASAATIAFSHFALPVYEDRKSVV